jgi:hypothetical protein
MFCSKFCEEKHLEESCKFNPRCSVYYEVAINIIKQAVNEFGSFQNFVRLFDNLKTSSNLSLFDFDEINGRNQISAFCSLAKLDDRKETADLNEFGENCPSEFYEQKEFLDCTLDIVEILRNNLMQVVDCVLQDDKTYSNVHSGQIICLFSSLFNHSCNPNIERVWYENKSVFFANRPIKKGEQLFISYGPSFHFMPIEERSQKNAQYGFKCDCQACNLNLPVFEFLPRIGFQISSISSNVEDTFDTHSAIKKFKENCEMINKISHYHPCYETVGLIWKNNDYIDQIARFRL